MKRIGSLALFISILFLCSCSGIAHYAKTGNIAGVRESLANGANINWKSNHGNTPLMIAAVEKNNAKMIEFLCKEGANVNHRNIHGSTGLILASYYNIPESVEALLRCNADKSIRDMWGNSALDYAEKYEYTHLIAILKK